MILPSIKEPTKTEAGKIASEIVAPVLSGEVDPLQIKIKISFLEEVIKQLKSDTQFNSDTFDEVSKYGKKTTIHGVEIAQGQSIQYEHCEAIAELKKACDDMIKSAENVAKSLQPGATAEVVNVFDGSVITVTAPIKKSKDIVKVTLPK